MENRELENGGINADRRLVKGTGIRKENNVHVVIGGQYEK